MTFKKNFLRCLGGLLATTLVLSSQSVFGQCNCGGHSGASVVGEHYDAQPSAMPIVMGQPVDSAAPNGGQLIESDSIYLTVSVPETAILTVNGDPTISVGTLRYFVIKGLDRTREYQFEVVAETANAAGVAMEETKTVKLRPGSAELVTLKPVKRKVAKKPDAEAGEKKVEDAGESKADDSADAIK
jgi:uncharacterized protein (TIGR03000 family)